MKLPMQNTTNSPSQEIQKASQVCSHCKNIKKGCDKRLPSCSQCLKRRIICNYNDGDTNQRSGSENSTTKSPLIKHEHLFFASEWPTIAPEVARSLPLNIRLSILLTKSLSTVFASDLAGFQETFPATNSVLHSQVHHIICTNGNDIDSVVFQYFHEIHPWLPILSRKRFLARLMLFRNDTQPDFSMLLAMRLITQHPSPDVEIDKDNQVLYLATKVIFAQAQASTPSSLLLTQAGIIIGHYEHARGMIEGAYVTVGTTARMDFAIGLHNKHCSLALQGSDVWMDEEEALSTWWALVILDRTISVDSQMSGRPLATRTVRENDHLPVDAEEMHTSSDFLHPRARYFVAALDIPYIGSFGREAQATFLYERIRLVIEAGNTNSSHLYMLGAELQALLAKVMEEAGEHIGGFDGAIQMLTLAIHKLCQTISGRTFLNEYPGYREAFEMLQQNTIRTIIDMAHTFNRHSQGVDLGTVSPAVGHMVRTAEQYLQNATSFQDHRWLEDFDQFRRMLSLVNRRWRFAGMELHRLNQMLEMAITLQF